MSRDDGEKWIVNLIRDTKMGTDAKIDLKKVRSALLPICFTYIALMTLCYSAATTNYLTPNHPHRTKSTSLVPTLLSTKPSSKRPVGWRSVPKFLASQWVNAPQEKKSRRATPESAAGKSDAWAGERGGSGRTRLRLRRLARYWFENMWYE
jgi:hypothetical protein